MSIPTWLHFLVDPTLFAHYGPTLWKGFKTTLALVGISFVISFFLGLIIAFARLSTNKILHYSARGFIYFFRGTPLMGQLFLFYFGLGSLTLFWQEIGLWWFFKNEWYCCLFVFSLNGAAYQAEILRGSIQAIAIGQHEAAQALSLNKKTTFAKIILPQAFIMALRPLGNELIIVIKSSAIASLITVHDLLGMTKLAYARTFNFQTYIWAAILYLLAVLVIQQIVNFIEARLTRHLR